MAKLSFILDGKSVKAEAGSTILEAALQNGGEIPTLCHDPRLKPYAACRMCLVEVEGARGFMASCATPLQEGMIVKTKTDDITKLRRMALELLLSDHFGDCIAPCKLACPAGIDIQGFIGLIANGQYKEALKLIKESNPLPLICGRICPRFCEEKCRRNLVDKPIAINALKRFVADFEQSNGGPYIPVPKAPTGHRVAIVGGGPAGLSAAYYLALDGYEVDIFEASPHLGGMLRYGIPEYRLPKAVLDKEIAIITGLCHQIRCNVSMGQDFTIDSLKADGYEAIFIALGAQASQKMGVEGEDLPGVLSGIGFLRDVVSQKEVALGQKVAIVGGGNTAIDSARTALRLGAAEVTVVYRRSREEMPASDEEVEQAEKEGVRFQFLAAPVKLIANDSRVDSVECIRMALGEPDSSGRRRPEPISGSEFTMEVNTLIAAIGQTVVTSGFSKDGQVKIDRRGTVLANNETMQTSREGLFAGGDCVSGPATVVEAVAAGKRAALSISQYLSGQQVAPVKEPYNCTKGALSEIDINDYKDVARLPRTKMPALVPDERKGNFAEVELGFNEKIAKAETERCLACGCQDVFDCKLRNLATEYGVKDNHYAGRKRHLPLRKDEPYIISDPNKCILCGSCVRICSEVQGLGVWGFVKRGFDTLIKPTLEMPLQETNCEFCGQCLSICPTGALTAKVYLPKPGPWKTEAVPSVCPYCGIGCNIALSVVGDQIVKVTSTVGSVVNNGNLCKKGAFGHWARQDAKRLRKPLIKHNARLVEVDWDNAISMATKGLKQIRDRSGRDRVAVLASPQLTNEENYLVQKFARMVLETNNISSLTPSVLKTGLAESFGVNASTCSYADMLSSDLILAFGCDLMEDYPVIGLKTREAVGKGVKLVIVNSHATRLDSLAEITLGVNPKTNAALLKMILNYIISHDLTDPDFVRSRITGLSELARELKPYRFEDVVDLLRTKPSRIIDVIHLYIRAKRPVIIIDTEKITPSELSLISNLALITGNVGRDGAGIIALRASGNAQGLIDMGVSPSYLPGQQPLGDKAIRRKFEAAWHKSLSVEKGSDAIGILEGVERGDIEGILVVGIDAVGKIGKAILETPIFSVLIDTVYPETPPYADVVLPGATFAESEGTFTNCERRIQRIHRTCSPPGGKENWEIISALSNALGYPMDYPSVSGIAAEIERLAPIYEAEKYGEPWPFLDNGKFRSRDGLARLRRTEPGDFEVLETLHSIASHT